MDERNIIIVNEKKIIYDENEYEYESCIFLKNIFTKIAYRIENEYNDCNLYNNSAKINDLFPLVIIIQDTLDSLEIETIKNYINEIFRRYNVILKRDIEIIVEYLSEIMENRVCCVKNDALYIINLDEKKYVLVNRNIDFNYMSIHLNKLFKDYKIILYKDKNENYEQYIINNTFTICSKSIINYIKNSNYKNYLLDSENILMKNKCNNLFSDLVIKFKFDYGYSINFTQNVLDERNELLRKSINSRTCIVFYDKLYDEKVIGKLSRKTQKYFHAFKSNQVYIYSLCTSIDSKENKNQDNLNYVLNILCELNFPRNGVLLGIGGGVLLDIIGFAAAQYRRRVDYIRIPTTLIGQVDAGIGVKVGINYNGKKNIIGSFYPPERVIIDYNFIYDLDKKKIDCGFSEIIKMAIINDEKLVDLSNDFNYDWICNKNNLISNHDIFDKLKIIIYQAVVNMMMHLRNDYFERKSLRRLVDFGHTFSPIIEEKSNYKISHGYAVALDMFVSIFIADQLDFITEKTYNQYIDLLIKYDLLIYSSFLVENKEQVFKDSIRKTIVHRGGNLNLVIPVEPIGNGDFINLDTCISCNKNEYIYIIDENKLYKLFINAVNELKNM